MWCVSADDTALDTVHPTSGDSFRGTVYVYERACGVEEEVIMKSLACLTVWWELVIRAHAVSVLALVCSLVQDLPAGLRRDGRSCGKGLSALQTQFYKKIYHCQAGRRLCLSDGSTANRPKSVWHWAKMNTWRIEGFSYQLSWKINK